MGKVKRNVSRCKHCDQEFDVKSKPKGWIANHSRWCLSNPKNRNGRKQPSGVQDWLTDPIKIKARNEKIRQHWANGRYDNIDNPGFSGRTHSKQVRKLISAGKKRWIENNPRLHWELTFGQKDSIPCRQLKEWLKSNGFIFEQEVRLIPGRKIQVDILFREIKLIVEVNGNQHYDSNGKLLPYYHSRHQLLLDAGWRVLELHYSTVFNHELVASLIENLSAKSCVFPIAKPT